VNENGDLVAQDRRYVMRITGDEPTGKAELDNFINPENRYPVIVTTSKLLTTGVDAQTCKLIVLDQRIESPTEFKQIIGRGTRINEAYDKYAFTIMDFKKATEQFADPNFDGDPVVIFEPRPDEPPIPPGTNDDDPDPLEPEPPGEGRPRQRYVVENVLVFVATERVQYYSKDGKLITESLKDYSRKAVRSSYASLNDFLKHWREAERKRTITKELEERGVFFEALAAEVGKDFDPFDLVCHVAFDQPPLTRRERAERVRKRNYFTRYREKARAVLSALLDKYADEGFEGIESLQVLNVQPLNSLGTPIELLKSFGGKDRYLQAVRELEEQLYTAA
jgi:type I restriction enzyme R subunit